MIKNKSRILSTKSHLQGVKSFVLTKGVFIVYCKIPCKIIKKCTNKIRAHGWQSKDCDKKSI